LPDILYNITNAYSSIYQSSGVDLDITGTQLYKQGKVWNQRLDREEYIVPIKYSFAKIIEQAQSKATESGYSLKIYDGYRPSSVSATLRNSLYTLYNTNETVQHNIDYDTQGNLWGQGWFLAQNVSSHNLGVAIDVTLVNNITKEECKMPTPMHELSTLAVKFITPDISPYSCDNYSDSMTNDAKLLNDFFILSGARGLSSEWWHFQDQEGLNELKAYLPNGMNWEPRKILSIK
jgi:D-alanyl-D-alanine dipeptidase